jgi:hypothetical protein
VPDTDAFLHHEPLTFFFIFLVVRFVAFLFFSGMCGWCNYKLHTQFWYGMVWRVLSLVLKHNTHCIDIRIAMAYIPTHNHCNHCQCGFTSKMVKRLFLRHTTVVVSKSQQHYITTLHDTQKTAQLFSRIHQILYDDDDDDNESV